ncbi:hypothetical protein [Nocardia crassostreae]|uniref:hypothetical protein n=1 Tax=Nocardia crassostreae TaxID=53428 RepID=UPI001FE08026|nr:hypothetical protein [Nocardia crassostreae]
MLAAEAEEIATIRALLARHYAGVDRAYADDLAPLGTDDTLVKRARALHGRIREKRRPRAELDSALLLAESLSAAGWMGEAIAVLTPVVLRCADLGWPRPIQDAGPGVQNVLRTLRTEMPLGNTDGVELPRAFLDSL